MFGRKESNQLRQRKQVLILESALNRLRLQADLQNIRLASTETAESLKGTQSFLPLLTLLAPVAGFMLTGRSRQGTWLSRLTWLAKWGPTLYQLWNRLSKRS